MARSEGEKESWGCEGPSSRRTGLRSPSGKGRDTDRRSSRAGPSGAHHRRAPREKAMSRKQLAWEPLCLRWAHRSPGLRAAVMRASELPLLLGTWRDSRRKGEVSTSGHRHVSRVAKRKVSSGGKGKRTGGKPRVVSRRDRGWKGVPSAKSKGVRSGRGGKKRVSALHLWAGMRRWLHVAAREKKG